MVFVFLISNILVAHVQQATWDLSPPLYLSSTLMCSPLNMCFVFLLFFVFKFQLAHVQRATWDIVLSLSFLSLQTLWSLFKLFCVALWTSLHLFSPLFVSLWTFFFSRLWLHMHMCKYVHFMMSVCLSFVLIWHLFWHVLFSLLTCVVLSFDMCLSLFLGVWFFLFLPQQPFFVYIVTTHAHV